MLGGGGGGYLCPLKMLLYSLSFLPYGDLVLPYSSYFLCELYLPMQLWNTHKLLCLKGSLCCGKTPKLYALYIIINDLR